MLWAVVAAEKLSSGLMVLVIELSLQDVVMKVVVLQCLGCCKSVF